MREGNHGRAKARTEIYAALDDALRRDAMLCCDRDPVFSTFARARKMAHYAIPAKSGSRVVNGAFHIQTVSQVHVALRRPSSGRSTDPPATSPAT